MKLGAVILGALALAGVATAGTGFNRATILEPAASSVTGAPTAVYCANTDATWTAFMQRNYSGEGNGLATPGVHRIWLPATVCTPLRLSLQGHQLGAYIATPIELLTHEAIHAKGEADEGQTDCQAIHQMPRVATTYFHVPPGRQLRALMAEAWQWHNQAAPQYRTVC